MKSSPVYTISVYIYKIYIPGTPRPTSSLWLAINWMMNQIFTNWKMVGNNQTFIKVETGCLEFKAPWYMFTLEDLFLRRSPFRDLNQSRFFP